jgi:hypothetical protein
MTILWIVDGQGWGHDIQSKQIAELLPHYDHKFISRKRHPKARNLMEIPEVYFERMRGMNADLIVAMHPEGCDPSLMHKAVLRLGMKTNGMEILS